MTTSQYTQRHPDSRQAQGQRKYITESAAHSSDSEEDANIQDLQTQQQPQHSSTFKPSFQRYSRPAVVPIDPRRNMGWLKAQKQYSQDIDNQRAPASRAEMIEASLEQNNSTHNNSLDSASRAAKRNQSDLIKEQELKCCADDRHASELRLENDVATPEETGTEGQLGALARKRPSQL